MPSVQNVVYNVPEEIDDDDADRKEKVNQRCQKPANFDELISIKSPISASYNPWPWHATISFLNNSRLKYLCSGSFITNDHILTCNNLN